MGQDSEFVRWSYTCASGGATHVLHHVLVFTVKKRCVLFTDIVEFTL